MKKAQHFDWMAHKPKMIEMGKAGATTKEIAEYLGKPVPATNSALGRLNISLKSLRGRRFDLTN